MDFLTFTTSHGVDYAINIEELIAVVQTPEITAVPGSPEAIIGMFSYLGEFVPVVDPSIVENESMQMAPLVIIVRAQSLYGILAQSVGQITRGDVPEDVRFIDANDYKNLVLGFDKNSKHIELF